MTLFGWLALCLAFSGISALASVDMAHASPPLSGEVAEHGPPPLQALEAVIERPLFSPSRRKPARTTGVIASGGSITLSAIVIGRGKRYAIIRDEAGGAGRRITEGETIGGSVIKRILPDRIVLLAAGGEESVIRLFDKESAVAEPLSRRATQ